MAFGLCNSLSTLQSMINDVFPDMLDAGIIPNMDDILVYMETGEEHVVLARQVMERLRKVNLYFSIKKSSFHQQVRPEN